MKRILSLILSIALLIPAAHAMGEKADPLVGSWYVYMEVSEAPAIETLQGYTHILMGFVFEPDGRIRFYEYDFKESGANPIEPTTSGKWEGGDGGVYTISQIGLDSGNAYLAGDLLYYPITNGAYYVLHRMTSMNWYSEIMYEDSVKRLLKK